MAIEGLDGARSQWTAVFAPDERVEEREGERTQHEHETVAIIPRFGINSRRLPVTPVYYGKYCVESMHLLVFVVSGLPYPRFVSNIYVTGRRTYQ